MATDLRWIGRCGGPRGAMTLYYVERADVFPAAAEVLPATIRDGETF